jgi:hypothetical protein
MVDFPKIDKIELLRLSHPTPVQTVKAVQKIVIVEKNVSDTNLSLPKRCVAIKKKAKKLAIASNSNINMSNERLFVIGDSMGEGITLGLGTMKKKYPIEYMSIAKCSTTTHYWLNYSGLEGKILAYKPTVILIVLGTNEWNGVGSATKLRILKLHNRIEKLGIKTLWVTPPVAKSTPFYEMVHDVYGEMVYDSRFLDVPRGHDHIHPTMQGYIRWTCDILSSLKKTR